jgi:prepilin-type N-terminal cleavage/methylation domain-containing protein/prepilin-type processing-associated H-X9-DG protein
MYRQKAFTLIELLVVIAIIALLMAVLMPALARVKKQAEAVACMANLKQWCLAFSMYTDENNGFFQDGLSISGALKPYYQNEKLLFCPSATKTVTEGARCPFSAREEVRGIGSYGINSWINSEEGGDNDQANRPDRFLWKTSEVKGGDGIPMYMDMDTFNNATVHKYDTPPEYEEETLDGNSNEMRSVCINRHNTYINMAFVDFSARKVGLKELWTLNWHRAYAEEAGDEPIWPYWMKNFKDYPWPW